MKNIIFSKLSGTGNDFIVVDNRKKSVINVKKFALTVCDRKRSVGADGVLLVEKSSIADYKMRIINSDGTEAEMCGNGIRCIGLFAYLKKIAGKEQSVETLSGLKAVTILSAVKGLVDVNMGLPKDEKMGLVINTGGKKFIGAFVNTGVPHTVILDTGVDVNEYGRQIRYHKVFKPAGTNVNFVKVVNKNTIKVRTYERGVEAETEACGTGSTASAYITNALCKTKFPTKVITKGGDILEIDADEEGNLYMSGNVTYICEGKIFY
ncbi:MAG: diaminopimelate epimerase [Candidatus Firestonebacteria bacterium RIFOXYA2_FULL_40_8]|nr:MAG: diaminopimelate epimerase [Candidatus Firestonebacteria bacterium RIFOXYA2_FULL_40_8]